MNSILLLLLFGLCMLWFLSRLIMIALRATWSFVRVFLYIILIPLILLGLALGGLLIVAFPLLLVGGIVAWAVSRN